MSKRLQIIIVILIAIILLVLGWFFLSPLFRAVVPSAQPPQQTQGTPLTTVTPTPQTGTEPVTGVAGTTSTYRGASLTDPAATLLNQARIAVERMGSGTSRDGFLGMMDVASQLTAAGQAKLRAERVQLQKDHPTTGAEFGMTTRSMSSRAFQGAFGDDSLVVEVQAVVAFDAGDASKPTKRVAKKFHLNVVKTATGAYLINSWSSEETEL